MKKKTKAFDEEERTLIKNVESGKSEQVTGKELESILQTVHSQTSKTISLRVNENDLQNIKTRAEKAGIPYQTLINSLIHRYITGDVVLKTQI